MQPRAHQHSHLAKVNPTQRTVNSPYVNTNSQSRLAPSQTVVMPNVQSSVQKLAALLQDQALFIAPGPSNRLALSLRSGIPDDIDYALETLLHACQVDPEILHLNAYPGLLDGLVGVIESGTRTKPLQSRSLSKATLGRRRSAAESRVQKQAIEASIVLAGLCNDARNVPILQQSKTLRHLTVQVLEDASSYESDPSTTDDTIEMQLAMLVVLEAIAPSWIVKFPPSTSAAQRQPRKEGQADEGDSHDASSPDDPACRIVPCLYRYCFSNDRALCVGAYRTLARLAGSESTTRQNEAIFTFSCSKSAPPNAVSRALELLPLKDRELSEASLEFLYVYSQIPSNVDQLAARPDVSSILYLLTTKLTSGTTREDTDVEPLSDAKQRLYLAQQQKQRLRAELAREHNPFITNSEMRLLAPLREPERTTRWMQWVYEAIPDAEITQVALWNAYKTRFESAELPDNNKMLGAAEVIKLASDAFPSATPMVIKEESKFIIRGIRVRDKQDLVAQCRLRWTSGQTTSSDPYSVCPATITDPANAPAQDVLCAALQVLIQSHQPVPPSSLAHRLLPAEPEKDKTAFWVHHTIWLPPVDLVTKGVQGPAFLATFVIRNLAQAIRLAMRPVSKKKSYEGPSILNALGEKQQAVTQQILPREAAVGADALLALEEDVLQLATSYKSLSAQFAEIMGIMSEIRKLQTDEANLEAEEMQIDDP